MLNTHISLLSTSEHLKWNPLRSWLLLTAFCNMHKSILLVQCTWWRKLERKKKIMQEKRNKKVREKEREKKEKKHTHIVTNDSRNGVDQGSSTRGPRSPLPWPAGRFEKITTNPSPARLHIISRFVVRLTLWPLFPIMCTCTSCIALWPAGIIEIVNVARTLWKVEDPWCRLSFCICLAAEEIYATYQSE
jgi:hypothetical protein